MSTELLMTRRLGALRPIDASAEEAFENIKENDVVRVRLIRPRSLEQHRWYWGLIDLVFNNQERYPSREMLSDAIKISVGHCETCALPSGSVFYRPKSISFAKCDQDKFNEFTNAVTDLVLKHFLPTVTKPELEAELRERLGA